MWENTKYEMKEMKDRVLINERNDLQFAITTHIQTLRHKCKEDDKNNLFESNITD